MRSAVVGLALGSASLACASSHASSTTAGHDGGALSDASSSTHDAGIVGSPRTPSTLPLRDLVGLSNHPLLGTDAVSANERAFEWAKLAELGIHRVRTDFTWATIEPARGTFDYTEYDTLVTDATAHGVDLLAILDYGVPWATSVQGADNGYPPDSPADFGAFAAAVATHFNAHVHEFEIWNEPNNGLPDWKPTLSGDPAKYGALVAEATKDILAVEPSAIVAYGGTVYDYIVTGPDFASQSFQDVPGLAASIPAFAMHAYEKYPPVAAPESTIETPLLDKIATMSGVLADAGARSVPIWITEIGWPTTPEDPPDQQARYTVRSVVLGALGGADRVFLYTLEDGPHPTSAPPEDAFGLVGYQADWADGGAPADKPAFVALKALLGAVGTYAVTRRLSVQPEDLFLIELGNAAGAKAWVAWRSIDGAAATSVTVPATGDLRVTHVDGSTLDDVATGAYPLQVGPDPVVVSPR